MEGMMPAGAMLAAARWHFGWGNPNTAGALLAMLWGLSWLPCLMTRKHYAICGGVASACGILMIPTASRGALLAVFVCGIYLYFIEKKSGKRNPLRLWVTVALGVLLLALPVSRMGNRVAQAVEGDASVAVRGDVYRALPAMMHAAGAGWGKGESGNAYGQWFQEPDSRAVWKHVLSMHGVFLVEHGWLLRFLYVEMWVLLGCLAVAGRRRKEGRADESDDSDDPDELGGDRAFVAASLAFFITGSFNQIATHPFIAIVGGGCVAWSLWGLRTRMSRRRGVFATAVSGGLIGLMFIAGARQNRDPQIKRMRSGTVICRGASDGDAVRVFAPDPAVAGGNYGGMIRKAALPLRCEVVPEHAAAPEENCAVLILTGGVFPDDPRWYARAERIVWINPPRREALPEGFLQAKRRLVLWGARNPRRDGRELRAYFGEDFQLLPGESVFIGDFYAKALRALAVNDTTNAGTELRGNGE